MRKSSILPQVFLKTDIFLTLCCMDAQTGQVFGMVRSHPYHPMFDYSHRLKFQILLCSTFGGMVGLCVKRSPLTKVSPVRLLAWAICEFSCALFLCCVTRVFQTIQFYSLGIKKTKHFRSLAVRRGHNGLMWLAAKGALVVCE